MFTPYRLKKLSVHLLALSVFCNTVGSAFASINDHAKDFFQTQTGSYLHAAYPLLKPKDAVIAAIDHVVTEHKNYLDTEFNNKGIIVFDYNNKAAELERLFTTVEPLLEQEIKHKDTHAIFYHGYSSAMSAYYNLMHEFMGVAQVKDLGKANPLHFKSPNANKIRNVNDFFAGDKYLKAHYDNVNKLKKLANTDPANYGKYKNLSPFSPVKNLGVGKAPDSSEYARDHLKCVNLSLFGNSEYQAESSFLFFLTSGNIAKLDRFLTTRLLKDNGIIKANATQQEIDAKLEVYEKLFNEKMGAAGGGLMQIMMKKSVVDQYGFASWAKGVPYLMDKKTGKFALRGHNNKPVADLTGSNKKYVRPSLLKLIEDYKKNPLKLSQTFSFDGKVNMKHVDRMQARLFINPEIFGNKNLVQINQVYRNAVNPADEQAYKAGLKQQITLDLIDAIANKQLSKEFYENRFALAKLVDVLFSKKRSVSDVVDLVMKSSGKVFSQAYEIVKQAVAKIANVGQHVVKKLKSLELLDKMKDAIVAAGKSGKKLAQKALKAIS